MSRVGVPSALAIAASSIPTNDPSTPLSPALYKFIFLLIAFIVLFWLIRLMIAMRRVYELWRGIRQESVGPGAAAHLTRDSLFAILRSHSFHKVEDVVQIHVQSHVQPNRCKVVRPIASLVKPLEAPLDPTHPPSAAAWYQLQLLISSTTVVKLEVYLGVPLKLVTQLHQSYDKFASRNQPKVKKTNPHAHATSSRPAANRQSSPSPPAAPADMAYSSQGSGSNSPISDDDCKLPHPSAAGVDGARVSIEMMSLESPSPLGPPHEHTGGAVTAAPLPTSSDQEHTEFLRSYIQESTAYLSLLRPGEFAWSHTFIVQPPIAPQPPSPDSEPSLHKATRRVTSPSLTHAPSSSTPAAFQQAFTVPIPLALFQQVCRDAAGTPTSPSTGGGSSKKSSSSSSPSSSGEIFPILIHVTPIDLTHGVGTVGKAARRIQHAVSEITIGEIVSGTAVATGSSATHSVTAPVQTAAESPATPSIPAGAFSDSPAAPIGSPPPAIVAPSPALPVSSSPPALSPAGGSSFSPEDGFLTRLKFEKQFLLVSPAHASSSKMFGASSVGPPTIVYEMEELYGIHTSVSLPDAAGAASPSPASTPATPPAAAADANNDCVVCMSDVKDIILLPCRHVCVCATCHENVSKCPVCRAPILSHMRFVDRSETVAAITKRKKSNMIRKPTTSAHTTRTATTPPHRS